jgi:hypothetical protein
MAMQITIARRLVEELIPTKAQALICIVLALMLLVGAEAQQVLHLLGIGNIALDATKSELQGRFTTILTSSIASATALVTFWASVGLIAYLICWGAYNVLIEARNEVTLRTQYTNRGHWHGATQTLALKAMGALPLIGLVAALKPGLALWLALVVPLLATISVNSIIFGILATLGLAVQLYLMLAFALLTFTPWYRSQAFAEAFTESSK